MAFDSGYDTYIDWVRNHELLTNFFYSDAGSTVADKHYRRKFERNHLDNPPAAPHHDLDVAQIALNALPDTVGCTPHAAKLAFKPLVAFERLAEHYPAIPDNNLNLAGGSPSPYLQSEVLLRCAQTLLSDLHAWITRGEFDPGGTLAPLANIRVAERKWLARLLPRPAAGTERLAFDPALVQIGIASPYPDEVCHGVLLLLRVTNIDKARIWLGALAVTAGGGSAPADGVFRTLAVTYSGLRRLGRPAGWLDKLPQEFKEGMEQRSGALGDLRGNHPDHWERPRYNWPQGQTGIQPQIELGTVDFILQLRTHLLPKEEDVVNGTLLPRLANLVASEIIPDREGVRVLHYQPMKTGVGGLAKEGARDHFGFVDGISQPALLPDPLNPQVPSRPPWHDWVRNGELFLGYGNERGDDAPNSADPVLDNGSFLVVRKLRQFVQRFDDHVAQVVAASPGTTPTLIRSKYLGRHPDGQPLVTPTGLSTNDFDFSGDLEGDACPFQSHIRRANPRAAQQDTRPANPTRTGPPPFPPRIVRRGMSYGPVRTVADKDLIDEPDRGLIFMAYNANIAEQFEVIQRWLSGGNSSGLSAEQDDPLLGVPEVGRRRVFTFSYPNTLDGGRKVEHVVLPNKPLVTLEWGLYAFVPSLAALKALATSTAAVTPPPPSFQAPLPKPNSTLDEARLLLEDDAQRGLVWSEVRKQAGGLCKAGAYGLLVGNLDKVLAVLKDDGAKFSVSGFGDRMRATIGDFYLGMDDVGPHAGHQIYAQRINDVVQNSVSEQDAFATTAGLAGAYLHTVKASSPALVDLVEFARHLTGHLCEVWIGLPDGTLMHHGTRHDDQSSDGLVRCPGHLLPVSRFVFGPHPLDQPIGNSAKALGPLVIQAFEKLIDQIDNGKRTATNLVRDILKVLTQSGVINLNERARVVAGVMLGFPPTVIVNLVGVLVSWVSKRQLWDHQCELYFSGASDYASTHAVLGVPFVRTMVRVLGPYVVWRKTVAADPFGAPGIATGCPVIAGLSSAAIEAGQLPPVQPGLANEQVLVFGGSRDTGHPYHAPHACPGDRMAMGVMLGAVAALLRAGTLRSQPDARMLELIP